jgi:hypothetical protein
MGVWVVNKLVSKVAQLLGTAIRPVMNALAHRGSSGATIVALDEHIVEFLQQKQQKALQTQLCLQCSQQLARVGWWQRTREEQPPARPQQVPRPASRPGSRESRSTSRSVRGPDHC